MPSTCHIDIETFSTVDLPKSGVYVYAEHQDTEITVLCYAFNKGPVNTWVPHDGVPESIVVPMLAFHEERGGTFTASVNIPTKLGLHAEDGGEFRAHNAQFEITNLNGLPGEKINFPLTELEQWTCTMAKCCAHGLPAGLEDAARALQVEHQKDTIGKIDMLQLSKPRRKVDEPRWTYAAAPEKFIRLFKYCVDDVEAERAIDVALKDLSKPERAVWLLDQRINQRGIAVDLEAVHNIQTLVSGYRTVLDDKCRAITGGIGPGKVAQLGDWARGQGFDIPDLQAETIRDILAAKTAPPKIHKVLHIRSLFGMAAVAKYWALEAATCSDGRLRGMFMYHRAATGRWAGNIVQLQNLYRGSVKDLNSLITACKALSLDWLRVLYQQNPMLLFASAVRGMFIAAPGKVLVAVDYGQVEARCVAWMAGQKDKLEAFSTHGMVYELTGAKIHHLPDDLDYLRSMKKNNPDARFNGKVAELACGFQGGWAAVAKMARKYNVKMKRHFAEKLKDDWRVANPRIVIMWRKLEDAALVAVAHPGQVVRSCKIRFKTSGDFLYMHLPSGRKLAYYKPEISIGHFGRNQVTYMGINTDTRQWMRVHAYGGRWTQNAAEGICRDLLARAMLAVEAAGYAVVAHVHDELIMEIDEDQADLTEVVDIMCDLPKWAKGFPIHADGFISKRYRKG